MNTTSTFGSLARDRLKELKEKQQSAERVSSIELPPAVVKLITGNEFWVKAKTNRYLKLVREGYKDQLLELAKMAMGKNNPANWFATVASVKMWERSLAFLKKSTVEIAKKAQGVADRLGVKVNSFILKQTWHNPRVEWCAVQAAEMGREKVKLFAWLCINQI